MVKEEAGRSFSPGNDILLERNIEMKWRRFFSGPKLAKNGPCYPVNFDLSLKTFWSKSFNTPISNIHPHIYLNAMVSCKNLDARIFL